MHRLLLPALCAALFCLSASAAQAEEPPPNVIVILVDDLGWADLGCQGSTYYRTPNIDRLAAEGMRFTDAYAACAVCSPTRAAVMTGRWPARLGVTDWIRASFQRPGLPSPESNPTEYVGGPDQRLLCPPNPFWLDNEEVTLAEALSAAGYATCHIGKWHLGYERNYPQHQGFDENHGGCDYGQPPSYFDPFTNDRTPQGIPTLKPREEGEYLTDREGDEAVGFIRRNAERPFFLYLANYAVHTPIQAKPELVEEYAAREKTHQRNAKYAAMVHSVDDAVGRVLATLEEEGLVENTLILFTSDNGGLLGPTSNLPLRSGKGFPYEGGIRVPLLVRWPAAVPAGAVSDEPVTSVDYFPTVLEAVGVEADSERELDGVSILPHLRGEEAAEGPGRPLLWHFPHYRGTVTPYSIVRLGDWKLIKRHEAPSFELYNLSEDLAEERDLAATHPQRVKRMDALLTAHLSAVGAKLPRPNPEYVDLPRVLLIGDSISIGYTASVQRLLKGKARVFRPLSRIGRRENCQGTTHGVQNVDRWLTQHGGDWDVIHFNFGLHDLKRVQPDTGANSNDPSHPRQAELEVYERQLREIVGKLEATGARLIFATTTPVPKGVKPRRDNEDVERYNRVARSIMEEHGIPIDALYALAAERLAEIQEPANVHFTAEGSKVLGERVAAEIETHGLGD